MDKENLIEWLKSEISEDAYSSWNGAMEYVIEQINNGAFEKEPCEFCSNDLEQGFQQDFETISCRFFVSGDFEKVIVKCNYCPSCGRQLSTKK